MVMKHMDMECRLSMRTCGEDFASFREIFLYRYYDQDLGNPETILDLGGYCGYAALAFAARFRNAKLATIEPHPGNFARLKTNLALNSRNRVRAMQAAATPTDGPVELFLGGGMTHGLTPTYHSTGGRITVEGLSVATILSRLGWESIDLLKIDIEGAEEVLFGARQPWLARVKTIIGEYHGAYGIPALKRDLEPLGFRVMGLPYPGIFMAAR